MHYYNIISAKNDIDLKIKWIPSTFVSDQCLTGFIVQHMTITSNISCVKNADYWERWSIKDGVLETCQYNYDDNWNPIPSYMIADFKDEIQKSPDGIVKFFAEVFWVPSNSGEYKLIELWKPAAVSNAGELSSTLRLDYDLTDYYICNRSCRWNYKEILNGANGGEYMCVT